MIRIYFTACLAFLLTLILHNDSNAQLGRDVVQLFLAEGESAGSYLGYQVAGLGDQNRDGFDDILIGAPGDRKALIYFGGNPMDTIPDLIFHKENEDGFGYALCNLGDFNGDTYTDFAIGSKNLVRVYWGVAELDTIADVFLPGAAFREICPAGDMNGDGYDDILISQVTWQSHQGRVSLYFGGAEPDSIEDWSAIGDSAYHYFGAEITGGGDINGDDYADIAISGWYRSYDYIKIFYGGMEMDTIPDIVLESLDITTESAFIDVNGDNFSDLCVQAIDTTALLYYGPILPDITPDLTLHGTSLSGIAWEISEAGDINDDGYSDIITGNYDGVGGFGQVLVFLGGPYMDGKYDIYISGLQGPYVCAGRSLGRAGDVNGDGVDDILFGSWCERDYNLQGRVVIFSGDTTLTAVLTDPPSSSKPHSFCLRQNYPNPFNESTVIEYDISSEQGTRTVLKIYNILGEEVVTLVDKHMSSGRYQEVWDGKDKFGKEVASGIYLCRLQVSNYHQMRKLLLLR